MIVFQDQHKNPRSSSGMDHMSLERIKENDAVFRALSFNQILPLKSGQFFLKG